MPNPNGLRRATQGNSAHRGNATYNRPDRAFAGAGSCAACWAAFSADDV